MRLGLVGPATGASASLPVALDRLLGEFGVDQVIYLGADAAIRHLHDSYELALAGGTGRSFEDRVAELAERGSPEELRAVLAAESELRRFESVRVLPPAPARAVEMLDDRFVLFVHDKATLDEDDIANAQIIVYSVAKQWLFRRFGPRAFFTPGPLEGGHIGILETDVDGRMTIAAHTLDGACVLRETLAGRSAKLSVSA